MSAEIIPIGQSIESLIAMALATCPSPETRRMYATQLRKFITGGYSLTREGVATFLQNERDAGKGYSTIESCLSAVRKLAEEAHVRRLLSDAEYYGIGQLSPGKAHRTRKGTWMTLAQVEAFLKLPDRSTYWGKRDACLLAIMVGCGLRREEMAQLRWSHYQEREGRMCWVDFMGKGRKRRTVPVPTWAARDVDAWKNAVYSQKQPVELPQRSHPYLPSAERNHWRMKFDPLLVMGGITTFHIYRLCAKYGARIGVDLAPHDLRRTLAQLMRKASAPLEQIQYTLGHESIETTAAYLGSSLELAPGAAAVDSIPLRPYYIVPQKEAEDAR